MVENIEKNAIKEQDEVKENIIVEIFKKLLGINFLTYGDKKEVLK
jgi:hypothetical protein